MKNHRLLAVIACLLLIASPAWALFDNDAKTAAAKELTQLLGMTEYYKGGFTTAGTMAATMVARDNPGKEDQAKKIVTDAYEEAYNTNKDAIENNNAKAYADTYSLEELQQMIVFFKTPVGQKLVQNYPDLNNKTHVENSKVISPVMKDIIQKVSDILRKNNLNVPREADVIMRNYALVMSKSTPDNKQCTVK